MANRDDESDLDSDDDLDSDEMSSQAGYLCCTHCPAKFSLMSQLERYPSHIYALTEQLLLSIPFFRHCQLAHRNKVEQKCNFCGEKLENFPALVDHHLKEHPSQIKTLLQGKKKRKYARKPLTRRRTSYEDELNRRGVVNVRTAFKGDIVITRLQNPAPQDTDISVLFLHLRAQIKEIFRKFYAQKASFR